MLALVISGFPDARSQSAYSRRQVLRTLIIRWLGASVTSTEDGEVVCRLMTIESGMHSMPCGTGNPAGRLVGQALPALPADGEVVCRLMTIESGMHSMPYGTCCRGTRVVDRAGIAEVAPALAEALAGHFRARGLIFCESVPANLEDRNIWQLMMLRRLYAVPLADKKSQFARSIANRSRLDRSGAAEWDMRNASCVRSRRAGSVRCRSGASRKCVPKRSSRCYTRAPS